MTGPYLYLVEGGTAFGAAVRQAAAEAIAEHGNLTTTAHGGIVSRDDGRLSDARTPKAHAGSHATGAADALAPSDIGAAPSSRQVATEAPLTGGGSLAADRTIKLQDVAGLSPGTYERATVTVDAKGRVTGIAVGAAGAVADASDTTKGASRLSAPPAVASDPIAVGVNDSSFAEHKAGLVLEWDSVTQITVWPGSAWIPALGRVRNVPAPIVKTFGTAAGQTNLASANAFYYVYLFDNAGTPDLEISAIAPVAYRGEAKIMGPRTAGGANDNSRRFLRSIRTGAANSVLRFVQCGRWTHYYDTVQGGVYRVLNVGRATTPTTISAAAIVPPSWAGVASLMVYNLATDRQPSFGVPEFVDQYTIAPQSYVPFDMPLSANRAFAYQYVTAPANAAHGLSVDVRGYEEGS